MVGSSCRGLHGDIIISVYVPSACSILLTVGIDYAVIHMTHPQPTVAKSSQPDTFSFCLCRPLIGRNAFLEQSIHPTLGGATATSETPNAR